VEKVGNKENENYRTRNRKEKGIKDGKIERKTK